MTMTDVILYCNQRERERDLRKKTKMTTHSSSTKTREGRQKQTAADRQQHRNALTVLWDTLHDVRVALLVQHFVSSRCLVLL